MFKTKRSWVSAGLAAALALLASPALMAAGAKTYVGSGRLGAADRAAVQRFMPKGAALAGVARGYGFGPAGKVILVTTQKPAMSGAFGAFALFKEGGKWRKRSLPLRGYWSGYEAQGAVRKNGTVVLLQTATTGVGPDAATPFQANQAVRYSKTSKRYYALKALTQKLEGETSAKVIAADLAQQP